MTSLSINQSPLGKETSYPSQYDASVLYPIARAPNRGELIIPEHWHGSDIWYAYEISWLNNKGKPIVAVGRFSIPWNSPFLIESKSFKLYLNSFNESQFENIRAVKKHMEHDLSAVAGAHVDVSLYALDPYDGPFMGHIIGELIDHQDIEISEYQPNPKLLHSNTNAKPINETLVSHLLKSNCPVTGQPDWGTVQISYTGHPIDKAALLRYIVSFRKHTEFHEHCVERMYSDIMEQCQPDQLFVMARYTRRGGLDINPWRSSHRIEVPDIRTARQ